LPKLVQRDIFIFLVNVLVSIYICLQFCKWTGLG